MTAQFSAEVRAGVPERRQTTLMRGNGDLWRIVTVWRSRRDLDGYLASLAPSEEPFATRLFRSSGGSPDVEVFDVVVDSTPQWWP